MLGLAISPKLAISTVVAALANTTTAEASTDILVGVWPNTISTDMVVSGELNVSTQLLSCPSRHKESMRWYPHALAWVLL